MERTQILESISEHFKRMKHFMMARDFRPAGLQFNQRIVLHLVATKKEMQVKDIALYLGTTPSAISQVMDVLLEEQLVEKQTSIADRRQALFSVTTAGKKRLKKAQKEHLKRLDEMCRGVSDKELESFLKTLQKVTQNIQEESDENTNR